MKNYIVIFGILATLLGYFYIARQSKRKKITHPDDFFLARGSADAAQYGAAQIVFALQMAAVYPFFVFTVQGQWWKAVINIIFWALGIFLFRALLPRFNRSAINIFGASNTIHSAISNLHNEPSLRRFTAWMTVIAFAGLAVFEIVWGAIIFKVLFPGEGSSVIYYMTVVALTVYLVLYINIGGQRASIGADQYQLVIGYLGLHGLMIWVILNEKVSLAITEFPLLGLIIVLISLFAIVIRWRGEHSNSVKTIKWLNRAAGISLISVIIAILYTSNRNINININISLLFPIDRYIEIINSQYFLLIGFYFFSLAIFFQFIDTSNWQRFNALARRDADGLAKARKGLLQYAFESPLSWLFPVALGLCALQFIEFPASEDPWLILLEKVMEVEGVAGIALAFFVFVGILAIFLSTAEGLLTAIGWTVAYDIKEVSRRIIDKGLKANKFTNEEIETVVNCGRDGIFLAMFFVVFAFIVCDLYSNGEGQRLLGVFMAFYSPMIAMAPSLLVPAIFGRVCDSTSALISIGAGSLIGIACGIITLFVPSNINDWLQWVSAPAAFIISWAVYLFGLRNASLVPDEIK